MWDIIDKIISIAFLLGIAIILFVVEPWLILFFVVWLIIVASSSDPKTKQDLDSDFYQDWLYNGSPDKNEAREDNPSDSCHNDYYQEDMFNPVIIHDIWMSTEKKTKYLKSDKWKNKKKQRLIIAEYRCEKCSNQNNLSCHHVTYIRLGDENINDLRILCQDCHDKLHEELGYSRQGHYPIIQQKGL